MALLIDGRDQRFETDPAPIHPVRLDQAVGYVHDLDEIDLIAIGRSLHVFGARDCLINSRHQLSGQRTGVSGCYALGEFLTVLHAQH